MEVVEDPNIPPSIAVGDVVLHRGSVTGEGKVIEVLFVRAKKTKFSRGPRWRVLVEFPDKHPPEGYRVGHLFCQHVDVSDVVRVTQGRLF